MSNADIVQSWKNEEYFSSTGGGYGLPENPAGFVELDDPFGDDRETRHMISGNPDCTFVLTAACCTTKVTCNVDCTFVVTCTASTRC
ncbi:MAG: mersacidin/lichenicidin family type 2 lantibiotic [Blastocatellia bacterium]